MNEPLNYFYEMYGCLPSSIKDAVFGEKYWAVMLEDGSIGVAANNMGGKAFDHLSPAFPDLDDKSHRILYAAYLNAVINNSSHALPSATGDIFEIIDFTKRQNTVMIGMFAPLVKKFRKRKISLKIFDMAPGRGDAFNMDDELEALSAAEIVIMTSTSLANGTFLSMRSVIPPFAELYLLGPSSPNSIDFMTNYSIRGIFSTVFEKGETEVLNIIRRGGGTKEFQPLGRKTAVFTA